MGGGYSSSHSDVHLWYHGTIDWLTPTSDSEASVTATERANWWTAAESNGVLAGFHFSRTGAGDRLSFDSPAGAGQPAIREGFNQFYDLGAGVNNNRAALPANNGDWPSLIRVHRATTNAVAQGQSTALTFHYQWARAPTHLATVRVYLDADWNPFNSNQWLLHETSVPGTGTDAVGYAGVSVGLDPAKAPLGRHALCVAVTAAGRTRHLYAPETVEVLPSLQPPTLDLATAAPGELHVGVNALPGQTVVLQSSTNLTEWFALATNTLTSHRWTHVDAPATAAPPRFYRALLQP